MLLPSFRKMTLLGASALILSGCAFAGGYTNAEKETVADLTPSRYQPASREIRDNIETQDNFTQAAFWGREYDLNPADLEAAIKLASVVRKMGNPGRAIEITQTTRAIYPKDPYLTAEYAAALISAERGQEAIPILDGGLRAAPGYGRLWSLKGAALDQTEEYDLARRHYGRALQITPNDPNVMANLGLSYALSGDPNTAENWLSRAAAQPGASASVRQNLTLIQRLQGKQPSLAGDVYSQNNTSLRGSPEANRYNEYANGQNYTAPRRTEPARPPARSYAAVGDTPQAGRRQTGPRRQAQPQYSNRTQQTRTAPQQPQYQQRASVERKPARAPYQPRSSAPPKAQPQFQTPASTYTSMRQAPAPAPGARTAQPTYNNGNFSARSNITVVGDSSGGPKTASDAARAAAAQSASRRKRMVVPMGDAPVSTSQKDILNRLAKNVGPRPTQLPAQQYNPRAPQSQAVPPVEEIPRRYRRAPVQQDNGYPQFAPQQAPQQPYANNTQQSQTPTRRGAARRR